MTVRGLHGAKFSRLNGTYDVDGMTIDVLDKGLGDHEIRAPGRLLVLKRQSDETPTDFLRRAKDELLKS